MPVTTSYVVGSDGRPVIDKRVSSILTYPMDWADWLNKVGPGTIITNAVWTASTGLTLSGASFNDTATAVTIAGGIANTVEWATCTISFGSGKTENRTLYFKMLAK